MPGTAVPRLVVTDAHRQLLKALVEARQLRKLTQAELGRLLSQDQTFVSKFERGVRHLSVIEFLDVAAALGIDPIPLFSKLKDSRNRER